MVLNGEQQIQIIRLDSKNITMREKNKIILFFFICLLCSCQNKSKLLNAQNIKYGKINEEVKLIEDFNFDNHLDTLKIIMRDSVNSDLMICFFSGHDSVISKKAIFPKGELYSDMSSSHIALSYKNGTIVLVQEYGSSNPEGWYTSYINYNIISKKFIVDSITDTWKNFDAKSDIDFMKSKTKLMKMNLVDFNAQSEFYSLNKL